MPLTAYVDESMRRRRNESVCLYVLAAAIIDDDDLDDIRSALRGLRYGKNATLHWRNERPDRLGQIASGIAVMPLSAVVAVCLFESSVSSERARRFCLAQLLLELQARGVERAIFDSRRRPDSRELKLLQA